MTKRIARLTLFFLILSQAQAWSMARKPRFDQKKVSDVPQPTPLTLRDCYERALRRSEAVAIRKQEIADAEAQFFKAASEALGDVDFIFTDLRQETPGGGGDSSSVGGTFRARERKEGKFVIKQPLFQGFKALGAITGAGSFKRQRQEERIRAEELLLLDVTRSFYEVLRQKKDVRTLQEIQGLFQKRIAELAEREKIGRSRLSEIATATVRMKSLEAELARSIGALAVARHILEFLVGIPIDPDQLIDEDLPQEKAPERELGLERAQVRADVKASQESLKTAWRSVVVAQSGFWPEISLENNNYVKREGFQSGIDWDLLLKVDVPLFRGGETLGKVKEALTRWRKAKLSYSKARREAKLEIQEAYQDYLASLAEAQALEEAANASKENFRLQKEEYARNLVSNLDVLEALESLQSTRRAVNRAHYEMKENYWRLQVARGGVLESGELV